MTRAFGTFYHDVVHLCIVDENVQEVFRAYLKSQEVVMPGVAGRITFLPSNDTVSHSYTFTSALIVQSHDDREVGALIVKGPYFMLTVQILALTVSP